MDNFKTQTTSVFYETFEPTEAKRFWDRFEFVYTPKHGSWLNMAAIELHGIKRAVFKSAYLRYRQNQRRSSGLAINRNNKNNKINWQFINKEAKVKLKRLYPSIED